MDWIGALSETTVSVLSFIGISKLGQMMGAFSPIQNPVQGFVSDRELSTALYGGGLHMVSKVSSDVVSSAVGNNAFGKAMKESNVFDPLLTGAVTYVAEAARGAEAPMTTSFINFGVAAGSDAFGQFANTLLTGR